MICVSTSMHRTVYSPELCLGSVWVFFFNRKLPTSVLEAKPFEWP